MTWADLKSKIEGFNEEQLGQSVRFFPDERPAIDLELSVQEEDFLANVGDGEDCWMRSDLEKYLLEPDCEVTLDDYEVIYPKGTVSLH